jgi:hypothetical protein
MKIAPVDSDGNIAVQKWSYGDRYRFMFGAWEVPLMANGKWWGDGG